MSVPDHWLAQEAARALLRDGSAFIIAPHRA